MANRILNNFSAMRFAQTCLAILFALCTSYTAIHLATQHHHGVGFAHQTSSEHEHSGDDHEGNGTTHGGGWHTLLDHSQGLAKSSQSFLPLYLLSLVATLAFFTLAEFKREVSPSYALKQLIWFSEPPLEPKQPGAPPFNS